MDPDGQADQPDRRRGRRRDPDRHAQLRSTPGSATHRPGCRGARSRRPSAARTDPSRCDPSKARLASACPGTTPPVSTNAVGAGPLTGPFQRSVTTPPTIEATARSVGGDTTIGAGGDDRRGADRVDQRRVAGAASCSSNDSAGSVTASARMVTGTAAAVTPGGNVDRPSAADVVAAGQCGAVCGGVADGDGLCARRRQRHRERRRRVRRRALRHDDVADADRRQFGARGGAPACVTSNARPATSRVPTRGDVDGLAAALQAVDPGPVPVAPTVIVSHGS